MAPPYPHVHVIINPASGPNRPILNTLNDVFRQHGVDWDVSITKRYGDAHAPGEGCYRRGVDLVVGYGGDGTQHELANAVIGTGMPMGILPGGTGNGFAREIGIPKELRPGGRAALHEQQRAQGGRGPRGRRALHPAPVCRSAPEAQTSREPEGALRPAGLCDHAAQAGAAGLSESEYRLTIDGRTVNLERNQVLHRELRQDRHRALRSTSTSAPATAYLDVFVVSRKPLSIMSAEARFLHLPTWDAGLYYWRGREITIEAQPEQAIWMDGEYHGSSPVTAQVVPGALAVVAP